MHINFKVVDKACKDFKHVEQVFNTTIAPLYGSQVEALGKIGAGSDRLCEMLYVDDVPQGIIVYKKDLQGGSFELKTLCLLEPAKVSNKGFGAMLLARVMDVAASRNAERIEVTVSSKSPALGFFTHKGFNVIRTCPDRYIKGDIENILTSPVVRPVIAVATAIAPPAATQRPPAPVLSFRAPTSSSSTTTTSTQTTAYPQYSSSSQTRSVPAISAPDFSCTLRGEYVRAISSGRKTYEGRVATAFFRGYIPGKTVEWTGGPEKVLTQIVSRKEFPSFRSMLTEIGYEKFVPGVRSLEDAVKLYDSIPGYTEKVRRDGALALEVRVITPSYEQRTATPSTYNEYPRVDQDSRKRDRQDYGYRDDRGYHNDSYRGDDYRYDNSKRYKRS